MKTKRTLKLMSAAIACCGAITLSGVTTLAAADPADDVVNAPQNAFYETNSSSCELHDFRSFTAVTDFDVYNSPVDLTPVRHVSSGETLSTNVSYAAADGSVWGYAYSDTAAEGWFRLDAVQVVYDSIAFTQEHQNELAPYSGQLDGFSAKEYLYFWTYPGSGQAENICVKGDEWFASGSTENLGERALYVYKDAAGSEWVYIDFLPGGWVYVPNPEQNLSGVTAPAVTTPTDPGDNGDDILYDDIEAGAMVSAVPDVSGTGRLSLIPVIVAAALSGAVIAADRKRK